MSESRDTVQEFGRELVNARQYKGITLEQISEITKIDEHYLKAMEDGKWDLLPRPYMEAFLKAYAQAVGMHVPKVMKKYREMVYLTQEEGFPESDDQQMVKEADQAVTGNDHPSEETPEMEPAKHWKKYAAAGILIVVLIIVVTLIFRSGPEKPPPILVDDQDSASQFEETEAEALSAVDGSETFSPTPSPTSDERARDTLGRSTIIKKKISTRFTLEARATQSCWLRATLDRNRVQDVLLVSGETLTWKVYQEIHLVAGNAGGLELIFNGDSLGILGPVGEPVTVVIGPEGIKSQKLGVERSPADTGAVERVRRP